MFNNISTTNINIISDHSNIVHEDDIIVQEKNIFEIYNLIETEFNIIKNYNSFKKFTFIHEVQLISISNTILNFVEKLSDVSAFIIRKMNGLLISQITKNHLNDMLKIHNELLYKLYKFNKISDEITTNIINVLKYDLNQKVIDYMDYDISNRYKFKILQIIDCIKRLNVFVELVKEKI